MSKLIPNNEILVRFVPNVLKSVQGELALFDKIQSHLEVAEDWLCANFLSAPMLDKIAASGDDATNKLLHHARMAEVAEAMLHAIPQLDLVLTPNGFGIVSNSNVAPASKERVERLLASLEKMRDDTLQVLLPMLTAEAAWVDTAPCQYFQSVLYPWLDLPRRLGSTDHIWQRFQELIPEWSRSSSDSLLTFFLLRLWTLCAMLTCLVHGAELRPLRTTKVLGSTSLP